MSKKGLALKAKGEKSGAKSGRQKPLPCVQCNLVDQCTHCQCTCSAVSESDVSVTWTCGSHEIGGFCRNSAYSSPTPPSDVVASREASLTPLPYGSGERSVSNTSTEFWRDLRDLFGVDTPLLNLIPPVKEVPVSSDFGELNFFWGEEGLHLKPVLSSAFWD